MRLLESTFPIAQVAGLDCIRQYVDEAREREMIDRRGKPAPSAWEPEGNWLSMAESERLLAMRAADTRIRWLAGRWLIKRLVTQTLGDSTIDWHYIHVESRDGQNRQSRPVVYIHGAASQLQVSVSHSARLIAAATSANERCRLGIDLAHRHRLSDGFRRQWFTDNENQNDTDHEFDFLRWSIKEAWYKATNRGEPFRPRRIDTSQLIGPSAWHDLVRQMRDSDSMTMTLPVGGTLRIRRTDDEYQTLICVPSYVAEQNLIGLAGRGSTIRGLSVHSNHGTRRNAISNGNHA